MFPNGPPENTLLVITGHIAFKPGSVCLIRGCGYCSIILCSNLMKISRRYPSCVRCWSHAALMISGYGISGRASISTSGLW